MKVLIIMPNSMVGGAETTGFNLATALLHAGHNVTAYILTKGTGELWSRLTDEDQFTLIASNARSEKAGLADFIRQLPLIARSGPFDLVYTSHVHINAFASLAMRIGLIRGRFLVSRESTRIFDRFSGIKLALYRVAYSLYGRQNLLICQTEEMRDSLLARVTLPPSVRVVVLPNPINRSRISQALATVEGSASTERTFRIVYAGRLIRLKRVSMILDALGRLQDRDWTFTILGTGHLRNELERQAHSLGISNRVTFGGQVTNPFHFFRNADLGLLTSEIEGFPNVILEMMACGTRHIIATPCTDAIRRLQGVEILEDATAASLSKAIARAIEQRPDSSRELCEFVDRHHSAEGYARAILQQLGPGLDL